MFSRKIAVDSLHSTLGVIARQWTTLDDATRSEIEELIQQYGPAIALPFGDDQVQPILDLLQQLWLRREHLPPAAAAALSSALDAPDRFTARTTPAERQMLLDDLVQVVDFRRYREPAGLASRISQLVGGNLDRLTPDERAAWKASDDAYRRGGSPGAYLDAVHANLGSEIAFLGTLLNAEKTWQGAPWREALPFGEEASAPEGTDVVLERYANVYFPAALLVTQKRVPLIVHVTQQPGAAASVKYSESALRLQVGDLTIVLAAADFSINGGAGGEKASAESENSRTVHVPVEHDCEPVVFFLTPLTAGRKQITVDLFQGDRAIRTLAFAAEVVTDPARLGNPSNVALEAVSLDQMLRQWDTPPPDLELRVMLLDDGRRLSFRLHSPSSADYHHKFVGETRLAAQPLSILKPLFDRLSTLARRQAVGPTGEEKGRVLAELSDIGNNLYEQLFPPELKAEYRRFRETHAGKTLMITSDEPHIPWEIVKPFSSDSDGAILYDDPPLCEMFRMSRWIAGRGAPDRITVTRGVWVAPAENLAAAQEESDFFLRLNRQRWDISLIGPLTTLAEVEQAFREGTAQLYHFACHGNFSADDPDESRLKLDGGFLRPSQMTGQRKAGLQRSKPLVFLNVCHSGRVGAGLTRLGGWAERFIDSGASAFIGTQWEINDALAARFMSEFYNRLWGLEGHDVMPLSAALHGARLVVRDADPANPTWMAYVLYGDPCGLARLGR